MRRLVIDHARLKTALRYAQAVRCICNIAGVSEMPMINEVIKAPEHYRKDFNWARGVFFDMRKRAEDLDIPLPTDAECLDPACTKTLRRQCKYEDDVPDDEFELAETAEHKDFSIAVHRLLKKGRFCYQPTILRDSEVVRTIFIRSKKLEVSLRIAKRAIDAFLATGEWPTKLGIPIPVNAPT